MSKRPAGDGAEESAKKSSKLEGMFLYVMQIRIHVLVLRKARNILRNFASRE